MKKKPLLLLGAHMSISGGIHKAIERSESIGCTAIQIFTKSNRQWYAKPLKAEDIEMFKKTWKNSSIQSIIAHASYLLNIGSINSDTEIKSYEALKIEFQRCSELGIPYLSIHPGSHTNTDSYICLEKISKNITKLLDSIPQGTILLEIMAGQGSQVGHSFEQLAYIINHSEHKNRIGICFDTCHAFAAGYDFTTEKTYNLMWEAFDNIIGLGKLKCIHVNDSQKDLGSHIDRHAEIGHGKIGLKAFELLFNDPLFFDVPKILETPNTELFDYKKNMDTLKSLLTKRTRIALGVE